MECAICNTLLTEIQLIRKNKFCSNACSIKELSRQRVGTHPKSKQKECVFCNIIFWVENWEGKKRKFCSPQCSSLNQKNKKKTIGKRYSMMGSKNPNWRGGHRSLHVLIRSLFEYKTWQKEVMKRDGFSCQDCGDDKGGNLEVDHIVPFAVILAKNNIRSTEQAIICDELWDTGNGRTLCKTCHKKTSTWGKKTFSILQKQYPYASA